MKATSSGGGTNSGTAASGHTGLLLTRALSLRPLHERPHIMQDKMSQHSQSVGTCEKPTFLLWLFRDLVFGDGRRNDEHLPARACCAHVLQVVVSVIRETHTDDFLPLIFCRWRIGRVAVQGGQRVPRTSCRLSLICALAHLIVRNKLKRIIAIFVFFVYNMERCRAFLVNKRFLATHFDQACQSSE